LGDPDVLRIIRAVADEPRPIVLIDGRSGSGKTELGAILAPAIGATLIRLDDMYPGWGGLAQGSAMVASELLDHNRWRRWDWGAGRPAEWHRVDPAAPLVIEGCGALSQTNRGRATFAVWVEADDAVRRRRALARDGAAYEPYWESWAAQEAEFIDREHPRELADLIVER
jgi:uridine kinase